uniref:NADH dehydrogenase [ubiquinone] 1 subunit C1, mitochondrial n=1 Tax=Marmota marmota marmota TaxID=9994 RepID=A0A8C5ZF19_MARMA
MAPSVLLCPFSGLLASLPGSRATLQQGQNSTCQTRQNKSDWLKVGLTLGTKSFLWSYLIKQHNKDVLEYKRRNCLD